MAHLIAPPSSPPSPSQPGPDYHSHYRHPATHTRTQHAPNSNFASRTQTTTEAPPRLASPGPRIPDATLRLRGAPAIHRRVTWTEDVIDNEGLGRKKSKVCCIFRRAREFGESSSEEDSSDSDSSSDDDASSGPEDDGRARPAGGCSHGHGAGGAGGHHHGKRKAKRPPSPNAYEKMPKMQRKRNPAEEGGKAPTS